MSVNMTILANSKYKSVKTFCAVQRFIFIFYCKFQLADILSFLKKYTCLKKIFGTSKLLKKMWSQIPLFQQISTSEPKFGMKFSKSKFQSCNLQLMTFLKRRLFCIEIHQQIAQILSKEGWKTSDISLKSNKKSVRKS